MNHLPIHSLTPKQQEQFLSQLYQLMASQVQSYHKHHHMGINSSVPTELAQELLESIDYTVRQIGSMHVYEKLEEALLLGQAMLEEKLIKARSMLRLVNATAPSWQTQCRTDALRYLHHYLAAYDHMHLAHKGPDGLFYPILIAPPEAIQGIDTCLFYLNILWIENQIMAAFPDSTLEQLWDRLPSAALNQCEHLLINAIGKTLLHSRLDCLIFTPDEYLLLYRTKSQLTEDTLHAAANTLCQKLDLKHEDAGIYIHSAASQLLHWTGKGVSLENVDSIFL